MHSTRWPTRTTAVVAVLTRQIAAVMVTRTPIRVGPETNQIDAQIRYFSVAEEYTALIEVGSAGKGRSRTQAEAGGNSLARHT